MLAGVVIDTSAAKPVTSVGLAAPARGEGAAAFAAAAAEPARPPGAPAAAHPRRRHAPGEAVRRSVHAFAAELRARGQPWGRRQPHADARHPLRLHVHFGRDARLCLPGRGPRRLADVLAAAAAGRGAALRHLDRHLLRGRPGSGPARELRRRCRPPGLAAAHGLPPAVLPGRAAAVLPDLPGVPVAHPAHRTAPLVAARCQPRAGGGAVLAGARAVRARPGC